VPSQSTPCITSSVPSLLVSVYSTSLPFPLLSWFAFLSSDVLWTFGWRLYARATSCSPAAVSDVFHLVVASSLALRALSLGMTVAGVPRLLKQVWSLLCFAVWRAHHQLITQHVLLLTSKRACSHYVLTNYRVHFCLVCLRLPVSGRILIFSWVGCPALWCLRWLPAAQCLRTLSAFC
jgi:hypothetical protein